MLGDVLLLLAGVATLLLLAVLGSGLWSTGLLLIPLVVVAL